MLLKLQLEYVYVIKFSLGLNYCLNFIITGIIFCWPNVATKKAENGLCFLTDYVSAA